MDTQGCIITHHKEGDKWYKITEPKRCNKKLLTRRCCNAKGHSGDCWHYDETGEFWKLDAEGNITSIDPESSNYPHPATMQQHCYIKKQITEEITDQAEIARLEEDLRTAFEREGFCV